MRPPCEIVQRDFLRAVRTFVARSLSETGFSQTEIASKMNMTQAAVSKYLTQPIAKTKLAPEIELLTKRLVEMIRSGNSTTDLLVHEVCATCMRSRLGSTLCEMHQKKVPALESANCQVCAQLLGGSDDELSKRAMVVGEMIDALRILELSETFVSIVPQIRANLVACDDKATTTQDVAGVPGRITIIDGFVRALVSPQFGSSSHTSELLLTAKKIWTGIRSCLYVSGRDVVVKAAKRHGFKVVTLSESDSTSKQIIETLRELKDIPGPRTKYPAIHSPGGFGVEPILYLFGPDARNLCEKCVELSSSISS